MNIVEFLTQEYHEKKLSIADIASEWGVNPITLTQFLRRHQIPRRSASERMKLAQGKRCEQQRKAKEKGYILPVTRNALMPMFDHCEENGLDIIEFIRAEYWDKKKTLLGMSKEWDIKRITLTRFMDDYGIPRRTLSETQFMTAEKPSAKQAALSL